MRPDTTQLPYAVTVLVSVVAHVMLLGTVGRAAHEAPPPHRTLVEVTVVHAPKPMPKVEAPPEPPPLRQHTRTLPMPASPKPQAAAAPMPTPNQTPPPDAAPEPIIPVFGISMPSTVTDSSFAVPTGSTIMAEPKPGDAKVAPAAYAVPDYQVNEHPKRLGECVADYPDAAKHQGIEGRVTLDVEIRADGHVGEVRVLKGLGHGLDEAAIDALKTCRFTPAKVGTANVATHIQYVYSFIIQD